MLTMTLLGPPKIEIQGESIDFGTNKAVALLAYLASNFRDHTRSELATFLWPEYSETNSSAALRQTLWTIKKNGVTEDFLWRDRRTVRLVQSPELWIDIHEFQYDIASCQIHDSFDDDQCHQLIDVLSKAALLYQGDFMAGFTLKDSANFDDWQGIQRNHYQREFINVLESLVYCHSNQKNYEAATSYNRQLVDFDPLEEHHHRSLMRLYAIQGKRAAAIQQYEICQNILSEELGISPADKTTYLYGVIKSGAFPPDDLAQHTTRKAIIDREDQQGDHATATESRVRLYDAADLILERPKQLVGREEILEQITSLIDSGERVLLTGLGGIGKTTVAASVAARFLDTGKGSVFWATIGHAKARAVLEQIAALKSPDPAQLREEISITVRKLLLEQKGLVILDNALDERALFYVMRAIPSAIPVIVTSRHIIPIDGEIVHVASLTITSAIKLLSYHSRVDYDADLHALELCEYLGYHPYAIEIAGKNLHALPELTPGRLLMQIRAAPHDMTVPGNYAPFERESIKSLLDASFNGLPSNARVAFTALGSLYAPQASIKLLTYILSLSQSEVLKIMELLRRHGLVEIIEAETHIPLHYRLHDLTFSYARGLRDEEEDNVQTFIDSITNFVKANSHDYNLLDLDQPHILSAAIHSNQLDNKQDLIHIMKIMLVDGYLDNRGLSAVLLELAEAAIEAIRQEGGDYREDLHFMLSKTGNAHAFQSQLDHALRAYQEALELAPTNHRRALILSVIGGVRVRQGADDYESYFDQAYAVAEANEDYEVMSQVLLHRGITAASYLKQPEDARKWFAKAVEIAAHLGDRAMYLPLYNLGVAELDLGNFQDALDILQRCLRIALESGNDLWIGDSTSSRARGFHGLGQRDRAHAGFKHALSIYRKYGAQSKVEWVTAFMKEHGYQISE